MQTTGASQVAAENARMTETQEAEPWWKRELRKRRGKIKRMRSEIERMKAALIKHNVPEHDWRFDESSDEEFDRGFFASKVFKAAQKNLLGTKPTEIVTKQKE